MIERNSDEWFAALDSFIGERESTPFCWGGNDCCGFAADWVRIVRGDDPLAGFRGLDTALAAARALSAAGGLLAAVTERLGAALPGTFAQVGDVVMVRHGDDQVAMGVCLGGHVAAPGPLGLLMVPLTHAEAAWRV